MTDVGLEEQFLLRVPPEVAKQIHHMMKDNDLDEVEFKFTDSRHGKFIVEGQEYKLTLVDLPCVVETHKTLDMRSYYKSGDIGQVIDQRIIQLSSKLFRDRDRVANLQTQMLLVEDKKDIEEKKEGEEALPPPKLYDHNYRLVDMGVTPATKNIRQRKFRKRPEVPREEVLAAEEELLRRMRGDAYAASENIEIVHESELLKEMGLPAQPEGEKKTPKKRKRKADDEGAEGENGEKPKKKRRKKGEAAADGAQPADGAAATGDGTAAGEEGKKPKKPRKKKEEKEGEPKEKKERKKKAPKAQATAPENASAVVAANNNNTAVAATSAPEPMNIVQEVKPVNPRVAELKEQLARFQSDINALQKQVDGDIAAVPLELNEVMRGRLEAKITRQQATINSKMTQMAALQQELNSLL